MVSQSLIARAGVLLLALHCLPARGAIETIVLTDAPVRDLQGHVYYLEDPGGSRSVEDVVSDPAAFRPLPGERIDFGFSESTYWVLLRLRNATESPIRRYLSFNMRFMQGLDVYLDGTAGLVHRMYDGVDVPFTAREIPHRHLVTDFTLGAGATVDVYIRYWSEGATALPLTIETESTLPDLQGVRDTVQAAFYTFLGFMFLYSLLFLVVVRDRVFAFYAGYLLTCGLYLAHMDGLTFQYLWPGWPQWNGYAALPLGIALNPAAALFSMAFLKTRERHPVYHRLLIGVIAGSIAWVLASEFLDASALKQYAFIFTFGCACLFLGGGLHAYLSGYKEARFYVMGWFGLTSAAVVTTFAHWSAGLVAVGISFELMRIGVIGDATLMGLAVLDQFNQTKRAKDEAVARETEAIRARYGLQNRLLGLEERYQLAQQLAADRGLQLATASHDLRQPLTSIRLSIRKLEGSAWHDQRKSLEQTLAYLEGLVERYLSAARGDADGRATEVAIEGSRLGLTESIEVSALLGNLRFMFEHDALAKSLRFRVVDCACRIEADLLAVVRILSNLAANAIRYTQRGGILIGCRRRPGALEICVYDTGPGIDAADLERIMGYFERANDDGEGYGLGLAISRSLAVEHGHRLHIRSVPGHGTCAALEVARAR